MEILAAATNYSTFDEKRNKYLETRHYSRTEQESRKILQITTADRAYTAYETCLRNVSTGPAILVWASKETTTEILLRVRYVNGPNEPSMRLSGSVDGGSVVGAPVGRLWNGAKKWGVNQEFLFKVNRLVGTSETNIIVTADSGLTPVSLTFSRADGTLTLKYAGAVDIPRPAQTKRVKTPNNDYNYCPCSAFGVQYGQCTNEVGRDHGICISRTTVSLTTQPPDFFKSCHAHL